MSLASPLARVRGLGSAGRGTEHWWQQRLTAILLFPLSLWFIYSLLSIDLSQLGAVREWLHRPLPAVLLLGYVAALLHHAQLGMQVVFEDYVEPEWQKLACIVLVKFLAMLLLLVSGLSILRVYTGA